MITLESGELSIIINLIIDIIHYYIIFITEFSRFGNIEDYTQSNNITVPGDK